MKGMKAQLNTVISSLPIAEMDANIASLVKERNALEDRLKSLGSGWAHPVMTSTEMDTLERRERYWANAAARREKIRQELWSIVKDSVPEDALVEELQVRGAPHAHPSTVLPNAANVLRRNNSALKTFDCSRLSEEYVSIRR